MTFELPSAKVDELFPSMDPSSAVRPTVRDSGAEIAVAYHLPGCKQSAVVAFSSATEWNYGYPNDEGLSEHPLWGRGLTFYNFHRLPDEQGKTRWIATFHDGTFEISAVSAKVLSPRTEGGPSVALDRVLGPGTNVELDSAV
jgi:hypothetical protein